MYLFVAPKVAGAGGISWAGFDGPRTMSDALRVRVLTSRRLGDDLLVTARPLR
jgi:riboflavin biosynthesis pyrimidine reductase